MPKVKPIQWSDNDLHSFARTHVGSFFVDYFPDRVECHWLGDDGMMVDTICTDLADGKSKCQAEFERRVLDCLEPDEEYKLVDLVGLFKDNPVSIGSGWEDE